MNANPFLIGTDPEFAVLYPDGNPYMYLTLPQGKLGTDHGGRVVELRPDPKHLASGICADIFRTLNRRELVPYRQYRWKAGGRAGDLPLGGHIHLDVRADTAETEPYVLALNRMNEWFDALELFPGNESVWRRGQGYGNIGDVRGSGRRPDGHARLEYRTPPSWLYSPNLAHLTLTAFKLAAVDPTQTLRSLDAPDVRPATKLRDFIRGFAATDSDAEEISARMPERTPFRDFYGDPNEDIKSAWGIPARPTESEPPTVEAAQLRAGAVIPGGPIRVVQAPSQEEYEAQLQRSIEWQRQAPATRQLIVNGRIWSSTP